MTFGPATAPQDRRALVLLLLAATVVLGAGLGLRDPWPADEPRFALVARQMVESGQWLIPHRGQEIYPDKPPVMMWLQGLAMLATGSLRVGFLLPSLLAGLLTLWLVWDLGRRLWTPREGLVAAVAVLSALMFTFQFKRAQIDPLVVAWITLANWGLARHLLRGPDWRAYWLGCFAAGLGVITKGVGVIALLMLVPYALARRRGWTHLWPGGEPGDRRRWAGGALAFFGAILLWLVPLAVTVAIQRTPDQLEYLQNILLRQTAGRYAGQIAGHDQPWWYFFPVVLLHFLPLTLVLGAAQNDWRAGWRARDGRLLVLLGWCALVLLFFTLAQGKREVYVLPMLPMLALAMAPTLVRLWHAHWLQAGAWTLALALGTALVGLGAWARSGRWKGMDRVMAERSLAADEVMAVAGVMLGIGVAVLLVALLARPRRGVAALLAGLALWWTGFGLLVAPLANDAVSARRVMARAAQVAGGQSIGLVAWREQNLLMAPKGSVDFGFRKSEAEQFERARRWLAEAPAQRWLFARARTVRPCVLPERVQDLGHANRLQWWMLRADALRPNCRLDAQESGRSQREDDDTD